MVKIVGKLADYSHEEQKGISYSALMTLRRDAYAEHVSGMEIPEGIKEWAAAMASRHGPIVKVWHNTIPWLEAFMVVRYGEEPTSWPKTFTEFDVTRATRWLNGQDVPSMVTILSASDGVKEVSA